MRENYWVKRIVNIFLSLVLVLVCISCSHGFMNCTHDCSDCSHDSPNRSLQSYKTQSYFPEKWETQNLPEYHVEIVQFHHEDKCDTCTFLQNTIIDLLKTTFKAESEKGTIIYHSVATNYAENLAIKQIFSVMEEDLCSSIYIEGEYTSIALWRDIFLLAENQPESVKQLLIEKLRTLIDQIQEMGKTDED